MKHIIRAIILLAILFLAAEYFQKSEGILGLISILAIIVFMYLIAAIISAIRRVIFAHKHLGKPFPPETKGWGCSLLLLMILLLTLVFVFRKTLGTHSFRVFQLLDHLVQPGADISPVVSWGILGLLTGSIYGSFVAWKKYKLNAAINLIPIGILMLLLAIFYLVNKPLYSAALDTARNSQTVYAYNLVTAEVYNTDADNNTNYKTAYLLDNNDKTAWITVTKTGTNTEIRFSFGSLQNFADKHLLCVGFAVKNGYRKSLQLWNNFARVKELSIKHNGRFITNAVLNDKNSDSKEIKINPIPISSFDNVSVSINAVYPGEKYPARVAISELVPIVEYER